MSTDLPTSKWASIQQAYEDKTTLYHERSITPRQRLYCALLMTGEGYMSTDGMQVSSRCLKWALAAFEKQGCVARVPEWYWITERLPGSALEALASKLEDEYFAKIKSTREAARIANLPTEAEIKEVLDMINAIDDEPSRQVVVRTLKIAFREEARQTLLGALSTEALNRLTHKFA